MSISKSRFTVAKLDAGMAILLTSDHHLIEFPSLLLPTGVVAGSIIDLNVAQNSTREKEERDAFSSLQNDIRNLFATHVPSTPELSVKNVTQTSVVLEWNLLDLATADMISLSLYKNGSQLGKIPNATTTTTKLSGLALDAEYSFQLVLRTTAGTFKSNNLKIKTHKMTNLSGLNVCISNVRPEERNRVAEILARIGAKPPHDKVRIDTTHFVTNKGMGDEYKKAQTMNIPIVIPEFVEACEAEGRLMRVGSYYLDSDPALRSKRLTSAPVPPMTGGNGQSSQTIADNTIPSVASVLPTQTTAFEEDPRVAEETSNLQTSIGNVANSARKAVETVTDTMKDLTVKSSDGLENVAARILGTRTDHDSLDAVVEPPTKDPSASASSAETKFAAQSGQAGDVEPHPAAARAVESLPDQLEAEVRATRDPVSQSSLEGDSAPGDMEDVAL